MDELGEKLDALLHDPQQLGRIAQLASSLVGDGGETQPPSEPQPEPGFDAGQLRRMLSAVRGSGRDSASRHLLEAMKPYLAEKRRRVRPAAACSSCCRSFRLQTSSRRICC